LRIFGYLIYTHTPKYKRKNLKPSGKKGIFVDYSELSKAYRIYILEQYWVEFIQDITFYEKVAYWNSKEDS